MLVPPTENLVVAKYAAGAGYSARQWADALARVDWDKAELLSDKPRSSVWRVRLSLQGVEREVVVKCEPIDTLKRKIQKTLKRTHAYRHWRGAGLLKAQGISTGAPYAIIYGRSGGAEIECLIVEWLPGVTLLEYMAEGGASVREEHEVARRVARLSYRFYFAALKNRDHKASNLVIDLQKVTRIEPDKESDPTVRESRFGTLWIDVEIDGMSVIDPVGVRRGRSWSLVTHLVMIVVEANGCGVLPRRSLLMRAAVELAEIIERNSEALPDHWGGGGVPRARDVAKENWKHIQMMAERRAGAAPLHDPLTTPVRAPSGADGATD